MNATPEQPEDASLEEAQAAVVRVMNEAEAAFDRHEIDADLCIGIRLTGVALAMKPAYRSAAMKIVREYADQVGLDFGVLETQMHARTYEQVQIARLETQIEGGAS